MEKLIICILFFATGCLLTAAGCYITREKWQEVVKEEVVVKYITEYKVNEKTHIVRYDDYYGNNFYGGLRELYCYNTKYEKESVEAVIEELENLRPRYDCTISSDKLNQIIDKYKEKLEQELICSNREPIEPKIISERIGK